MKILCSEVVTSDLRADGSPDPTGVTMPVYPCKQYKFILGHVPRQLLDLEEARDVLLKVSEAEGYCIADFKFGAVALPLKLMDQLKDMVGKRCGVLRIDGNYRISCLDDCRVKSMDRILGR